MNGVAYVALSWLVYAVWGLTAALLNGERFDAKKLARSLLWAVLVTVLAVFTQLAPAQVITAYGTLIDTILTLIMNSGPVIALIWFFERLYLAITALARRVQVTVSGSAGS
ncbi:MAG: hypothetical protein ACE5KC_02000 [Candidatus Bathyarchaeia archaeon]